MLGAIDDEGQTKKPLYEIGPVEQRGANVMHVNNHVNYVEFQWFYNILRYLQDFKEDFTILYHVGVGKFCPHITTEVDCEFLFSQSGFLSKPTRSKTGICMYKRLEVENHRLGHIHCSIPIFKEFFMKLRKEKLYEEEDESDDRECLKLKR